MIGVSTNVRALAALLLLTPAGLAAAPDSITSPVAVRHVWRSPEFPNTEIDSLALWRGKDDEPLLYVTSKPADTVEVLNAVSGEKVRTLGKKGKGPGEFKRPNGIAVIDDYLLVVERDNHRVQVFSLPGEKSVLEFGKKELRKPYGIALAKSDTGWSIFITDDYDLGTTETGGKPDATERIKQYAWETTGTPPTVRFVKAFGDKDGPGRLDIVESIVADEAKKQLYICDEKDRSVLVYTLDGQFTGETFGDSIIENDPEGIVVADVPRADGSTSAVIMLSDQGASATLFRVFDRDTKRHLGAFTGEPVIANTDGIALGRVDDSPFEGWAFFAVHDDKCVDAFALRDVLEKMGLTR
jgi:3-phytase